MKPRAMTWFEDMSGLTTVEGCGWKHSGHAMRLVERASGSTGIDLHSVEG